VKKSTYIILFFLALIVAGVGWWINNRIQSKLDVFSVVPSNAAWIYESQDVIAHANKLFASEVWKGLQNIEVFSNMRSSFLVLDSITGGDGSLDRLLKGNPILISCHVVKNDSFDFLFSFQIEDKGSTEGFYKAILFFQETHGLKKNERIYKGLKIHELKHPKSGEIVFSYLVHRDVFAGSFTPFLVEDIIRVLVGEDEGFFHSNSKLLSIPKLENDEGNLYLNYNNFTTFLSVFASVELKEWVRKWGQIGHNAFFDFSLSNEALLFNGFSTVQKDAKQTLSTIDKQTPVSSDIFHYVSVNSGIVFHFNSDNPSTFFSHSIEGDNTSESQKRREEFSKDYGFSFEQMVAGIGNEWGLVLQELSVGQVPKLTYLKTKDLNDVLGQLNKVAEQSALSQGDTVFVDHYAGTEIRELGVKDFPEMLLGPVFSGFENVYYSVLGNYIVFGNSISAIKNVLNDIEAENTWAKSVHFNKFLQGTLKDANFSIMFNTQKFWDILIPGLDVKWQQYFLQNSGVLQSFNLGAIQFIDLSENIYSSLTLKYDQTASPKASYLSFKREFVTEFSSPIISNPVVVKNHINNQAELFLHENGGLISLVSRDGVVHWQDSIGGSKIISPIYQVDFFKNAKLQYAFITSNKLFIIDRLGRAVDGFPLALPAGVVAEKLSILDYDNSKQYRFLIADKTGALYMYSKERENLEGWTPLNSGSKFSVAPFHVRVKGRDFILGVHENGTVVNYSRKGEVQKGFPMELGGKVSTAMFAELGSDFSNSIFTTITIDGVLVKFNLEGKIVDRNQLYRPSNDSKFHLVTETNGKRYVIARQDLARLTLLDREGNELFTKDYLTSNQLHVQYFDFGTGKRVYAISDKIQEFTYLYDESGKLINFRPLESSQGVSVLYNELEKKYHVYHVIENQLVLSSF
jgi:hypothetical protein